MWERIQEIEDGEKRTWCDGPQVYILFVPFALWLGLYYWWVTMTHMEHSTPFYFPWLCTPICPSISDCFMCIGLRLFGLPTSGVSGWIRCYLIRWGDFSLIWLDLVSEWNVLDDAVLGYVSDGLCWLWWSDYQGCDWMMGGALNSGLYVWWCFRVEGVGCALMYDLGSRVS